jgi:hypothetical protein
MLLQSSEVLLGLDRERQAVVLIKKSLNGIGILGICDRASHDWRTDNWLLEFVLIGFDPSISFECLRGYLLQSCFLLAHLRIQTSQLCLGLFDVALQLFPFFLDWDSLLLNTSRFGLELPLFKSFLALRADIRYK